MNLNPCPFCNCTDTRTEMIPDDSTWYVVCEICESIGPTELTATLAEIAWNNGTSRTKRLEKKDTK